MCKCKNNYIKTIYLFILIFLSITSVSAECTTKEKDRLYKIASNIKLNYIYEEQYDELEEERYVTISVLVTGLSDELYVKQYNGIGAIFKKENEIDGVITVDGFSDGTNKFQVYAVNSQCSDVIKTVNFTIPKLNYYYYDELCDGIQNDFSLCDKWYQGNISYSTFEKKVKAYRESLKKEDKKDAIVKVELPWYRNASNFILEYYVYCVIGAVILIGLIIFGVIKYREKRSGF